MYPIFVGNKICKENTPNKKRSKNGSIYFYLVIFLPSFSYCFEGFKNSFVVNLRIIGTFLQNIANS